VELQSGRLARDETNKQSKRKNAAGGGAVYYLNWLDGQGQEKEGGRKEASTTDDRRAKKGKRVTREHEKIGRLFESPEGKLRFPIFGEALEEDKELHTQVASAHH